MSNLDALDELFVCAMELALFLSAKSNVPLTHAERGEADRLFAAFETAKSASFEAGATQEDVDIAVHGAEVDVGLIEEILARGTRVTVELGVE